MIEEINKRSSRKFVFILISFIITLLIVFLLSLMIGQYGFLSPIEMFNTLKHFVKPDSNVSMTTLNVLRYIRFPRTLAALLIGGSLAISGLVYQNTFNNNLVSPDILGVSSGACVGAGIAILLGLSGAFVSLIAFVFGFIAVIITLLLPRIFKNKSTLMLVLSGIIVGSLMNSII